MRNVIDVAPLLVATWYGSSIPCSISASTLSAVTTRGLEVDVNKDSVGQETRSGFAIDTKHVRTQVMVEDGGTVVLGGIYQQSERGTDSKVPLLGDIPVLGVFFRSTGRSQEKTELMVFITPKIVADRPATR